MDKYRADYLAKARRGSSSHDRRLPKDRRLRVRRRRSRVGSLVVSDATEITTISLDCPESAEGSTRCTGSTRSRLAGFATTIGLLIARIDTLSTTCSTAAQRDRGELPHTCSDGNRCYDLSPPPTSHSTTPASIHTYPGRDRTPT